MLKISQFIFNHFGENTFLAVDHATKEAAVIDPGMMNSEECKVFTDFISKNNIKLTQIILTHGHIDHCLGVGYVVDKYGVPVKGHEKDEFLLAGISEQARRFGMNKTEHKEITFDVKLKDGDIIKIGESRLLVIHVPGHSPGGIVLYDEADKIAFAGDSIFEGSIGRTDLEGGDFPTLIHSLKSKILSLPENTILLPGHGDPTTVKNEKDSNPFLK